MKNFDRINQFIKLPKILRGRLLGRLLCRCSDWLCEEAAWAYASLFVLPSVGTVCVIMLFSGVTDIQVKSLQKTVDAQSAEISRLHLLTGHAHVRFACIFEKLKDQDAEISSLVRLQGLARSEVMADNDQGLHGLIREREAAIFGFDDSDVGGEDVLSNFRLWD